MSVECDNVKPDEETPTKDSTTETQDITAEPTLTQNTSFPEKTATKTPEVKESSRLTEAIKEAAGVAMTLIPSVRSDQDDVQTHTDEEVSEACAKSSDAGEPNEEAGSTEVQSPDSEKRCKLIELLERKCKSLLIMSVECDNVKPDEETPTKDSTTETQDITAEPTLTQNTSFPEKTATKTPEVKESSRLTEAIKEAAGVAMTLIPSVRSDQDDVQTHTDEEVSEACAKSSDAGEPNEEAGSTEVSSFGGLLTTLIFIY
ncbi:hypothetical protein AHF37_10607 [Paragonimus kellicotti]|nr:hypothetical protein AHF37_10607 [Paragonimus kellicotti]